MTLVGLTGACWFAWVWFVADRPPATGVAGRSAATIAAFIGSVVVMGVIGSAFNGVALWSWALYYPEAAAARLFGLEVVVPSSDSMRADAFALHYAALAAVVALFLATPGASWRDRFRAALVRGIPCAFGSQLAVAVATFAGTARHSLEHRPALQELGSVPRRSPVVTWIRGLPHTPELISRR